MNISAAVFSEAVSYELLKARTSVELLRLAVDCDAFAVIKTASVIVALE